jgi:wyosine [tRNA(Phe)-imidazoG37] synthetase (radical SAM superfamily)
MLIQNFNDDIGEITAIADFLAKLKPEVAYLSIPSRPPAVKTVAAASEKTINTAYQIFKQRSVKSECLLGYEGNAFAFTGNIKDDLLSITAVHPMREDAVTEFLKKANAGWEIITRLIKDGNLIEVDYLGTKFYMRKW